VAFACDGEELAVDPLRFTIFFPHCVHELQIFTISIFVSSVIPFERSNLDYE
jgi:hypothetical protein